MGEKSKPRRFLRLPSPAMVVACIALAISLSGAAYAAVVLPRNSVGSPQVKNNSLKGVDINEARLRTVPSAATAGSANTAANAGNADKLDGKDSAEFLGGNITVERVDVAVPDNSSRTGLAQCPAGKRIIGGSVNIAAAESVDVNITVSRPSSGGAAQSLPNSGEGFDGWRGAVSNPTGGTGATTMRVWAICAS